MRSLLATSRSAPASSSRWRWSTSSCQRMRTHPCNTGSSSDSSGIWASVCDPRNLRLRWHDSDELAHYAKATADVEYLFPMGWSELEGIANRTDFDLLQHSKTSGKSLTVFDEEAKQHVTPYVIEPSGGVDRATLAFLVDSYREERGARRDPSPPQTPQGPLSRPGRRAAPQPQPAPPSLVPAGIRYGPNRFPCPV